MFHRLITPAIRSLVLKQRYVANPSVVRMLQGYKQGPPPVTMDDLPVPCGDWRTQYNRDQAKYNTQLILGVAMFTATVLVYVYSGLFFYNFLPPDAPAESYD